MKIKRKNKNSLMFNIICIIFTLICLLSLTIFSYFVFKINIVPTKYLVIGFGLFVLVILFLLLTIFGRGKRFIKIIALVIMTLISIGFGYATYYLNTTYNFFKNTQIKDYDTLTYSVVVLKDSVYSKIEDLNSMTISYLDDDYDGDIKTSLNDKIKYNELLVTEFGLLPDYLLNKEVDSIVLEESYLFLINEEVENFEESTKVIYTFEVRVKSHQEDVGTVDVSTEPFILYISGIDQYGNVNSVRGRSDVNMLVVVNPKTHHILLVNTPRDYYVQLAGTTGLKDKLTHAGIYGIDKSINTLENLYSVDINHYLRVNFNTLIKIVDVIGGIEVYSDTDLYLLHDKNYHVQVGMNKMNGKQALAYARERYGYITGDHHRGQNQQDIITAIIDKVSKSHVLISKYNSILNTLNGSFQTDMPMDTITSFIRYQLDKMPSWTVESTAVTGSNGMDYTYSMGTGYKLYVMIPDYSSVNTVKSRIQEVLNEQ